MVDLLKPQTAGTAVLESGSTIGDAGNKIYMKVQAVQFNFSTNIADTTGDGDALPHYDHAGEVRGQVSFRGFMLASDHIGIENLSSGDNPVTAHFKLGSGTSGTDRVYKFKLMISNIVVDWNRLQGLVGVAVQGVVTDNVTADLPVDETN
ncbi:MAG: hypothetical protein Unbinned3138contig1001_22 [Prokaryotic dsDNA virus sp.]|nr:MAG: hypothetical protein Unbinned3138contig1001_22 [Prokaryotic dsDNA virus sp.]|tara:strand:+ start:14136 stop:14585 length:450 start_codon:yes stop_codon:yes gene_type:complete